SSLLDLQDDLADAVMCLASSWSSDLPEPCLAPASDSRPGGDLAPFVAVTVACCSADELDRVARALEVPVTRDVAAGDQGVLQDHAVRRLGRVRIVASRRIGSGPQAPSG